MIEESHSDKSDSSNARNGGEDDAQEYKVEHFDAFLQKWLAGAQVPDDAPPSATVTKSETLKFLVDGVRLWVPECGSEGADQPICSQAGH